MGRLLQSGQAVKQLRVIHQEHFQLSIILGTRSREKIPNQFDKGENKAGPYIQAKVKRHHHDIYSGYFR